MQRSSKSGLFLIEMIFVILFFSLIAAVYASVFVRAHKTGEESRNLTEAVMTATNLAEAFYASGTDTDALRELFPEARIDTVTKPDGNPEHTLILLYDEAWQEMPGAVSTNDTRFAANLLVTHEEPYDKAEIIITGEVLHAAYYDAEELYRLSVTRYAPAETEVAP